jgi:hypothetical protein
MNFLHTMRGSLTREVMPFHNTSKTATLTDRLNVNINNLCQVCYGDFLPDFVVFSRTAEFAYKFLGLAFSLSNGLNPRRSTALTALTT